MSAPTGPVKEIPKRVTSIRFHKEWYTRRQVKAMLLISRGAFSDWEARDHFGPRFRCVLYPMVEAGVVKSDWFDGAFGDCSWWSLTVAGMDDFAILEERYGAHESEGLLPRLME